MSFEQLENKGFAFLNESISSNKRQIVVIGTARGGTSLVSGALHHLGIFTGEKSNAPVFEDVLLSDAFEKNDLDAALEITKRYTEEHDVWAWKRPAALNYFEKIEKTIPNPFYIFIFKDIFAIANRNNISMESDICTSLRNAMNDYSKMIDFIEATDKPVMLVSAEKALQNKNHFIDALIKLNRDIKDCSENKSQALEFITPNPKQYLDETRITKSKGCVDSVSSSIISGWAKAVHHNSPVTVELYINGDYVSSSIADIPRQDLKEKGIHPVGQCGFQFSNVSQALHHEVEVKVKDDIRYLNTLR
ncbi:MAG: hypothetical protein ACI9VT_000431 [Psychroserpens sp.]|jgi:hypothetical protein